MSKLVSTALALALIAFCVQSIHGLSTRIHTITEDEQIARNHVASSLYARLATMPQPYKRTEIKRAIHEFISENKQVRGATLFDAQGRLVAQLGQGNDQLLTHPRGLATARVPVKPSQTDAGHVLLNFRSGHTLTDSLFYHAALASALVLLCILLVWIMWYWGRILLSMRAHKEHPTERMPGV